MSRLASDPVFNALTRPQMIGGVTYPFAILTLIIVYIYLFGTKVTDAEFATLRLYPDRFHGEWNYLIKPNVRTN